MKEVIDLKGQEMKTLIIVRHAKSSWDDISLADIDRPLNERGKRDAKEMAARLAKKGLRPDIMISSPAKRARKTSKRFLKEFDFDQDALRIEPALYEAPVKNFYQVIENLDNDFKTAILFSHNPGITDFVNDLGCLPVYNMPTCGVFAIEIQTGDWSEVQTADKKFLFFDYPKNEDSD